ncbi:MAG TPA: PrsW family glutamic-type intramembrane protease [Ktedonobacterales bacterium]|nr:PrsW family glutamic-type intramembrane protease [Ktedonobacterales bacterium]
MPGSAVIRHLRLRRNAPHVVAHAAAPSLGVLRLLTDGKVRTEPGEGAVYPISASATAIGRGLSNGVVLLDPSVSREHARLVRTAEGWWIENLSAKNPLWVEGQQIAPGDGRTIVPGEVLQLGQSRLQLLAPPHRAPPPPRAGTLELVTDEVSRTDLGADDDSAYPLDEITATGVSATRLFAPGVTLQFALTGRFSRSTRWMLSSVAVLLFVVSAVITLGTTALVGHSALVSQGVGRVLAAITIPLIPVMGVVVLVTLLDRYEREPWPTLLGAFLWGAVIAVPPTLILERMSVSGLLDLLRTLSTATGLEQALVQAISAGVIEEAAKGAGLLLLVLFFRDEFDNVTDGIVYAVVIGAGFAMVENFVYFAIAPRSDLGFLFVGRVVLGWLSHSTFTALFGAALGYARETRHQRRRWMIPLLGFIAAVVLHTAFDSVAFGADVLAASGAMVQLGALFAVGTLLAEYLPLFTVQSLLLRVTFGALEREAGVVRAYLVPEVLDGTITPDEYVLVQDASLRAAAEHQYGLVYGLRAYFTARALYQVVIGLAFRHWHVAMGDPPKRAPRQPEDAYRARIAKLRRSLQRQLRVQVARGGFQAAGRSAEPTRPLVR